MNFIKTFAVAALCLHARFAGAEVLYKNPVIAGDHPDPSIIRVGIFVEHLGTRNSRMETQRRDRKSFDEVHDAQATEKLSPQART